MTRFRRSAERLSVPRAAALAAWAALLANPFMPAAAIAACTAVLPTLPRVEQPTETVDDPGAPATAATPDTAHAQSNPSPSPTGTNVPAAAGASAPQATTASEPRATAERGLVAEVIVSDAPRGLRAKPDQPLSAPILVRVAQLNAADSATPRYRVEFIGAVAGDFDLRPYLELADGSPATSLAPIPVRVTSQLPPDHGSDLFRVPDPPFRLESHYQTLVIVLAAVWVLIPVVVWTRRWLRRTPPPIVAPPAPEPTLADHLRPLIERAMSEGLSIREQGRLELLLVRFWAERLGMTDVPPTEVLAHLRRHAEAGELLRSVERWLHARGEGHAQPTVDLTELLRPYRSAPAPRDGEGPSGAHRDGAAVPMATSGREGPGAILESARRGGAAAPSREEAP